MTTEPELPVVVPYDTAWPERGRELCAELGAALGPLALLVQHIGSTSIPGMAAKPVYDLQVRVTDLDEAEAAFAGPLADLGFRLSPYRRDHVPAGLDDHPSRWAKRFWSRRGTSADPVNLHVRLDGSPNERLALLFRDWFRTHPEAVPAYAHFKYALASRVADTGTYADVKDPVVDLVVAVAEAWATETGWTPEPTV
ncbi:MULTISPECIES: GrpB family protein [unclassified Streptomyces]|uniref:GrpB family protein n=1 Tax=unclassified Streptomyces TaxID=2593676 RepID=UPI0036E2292C